MQTATRRAKAALDAVRRRQRGGELTVLDRYSQAINNAIDQLERAGWPEGEIVEVSEGWDGPLRDVVVFRLVTNLPYKFGFDADGNILQELMNERWVFKRQSDIESLFDSALDALTLAANNIADRVALKS